MNMYTGEFKEGDLIRVWVVWKEDKNTEYRIQKYYTKDTKWWYDIHATEKTLDLYLRFLSEDELKLVEYGVV